MTCAGCGNPRAVVTRTIALATSLVEMCDAPECGNLKTPWVPDVHFSRPEVIEHLADQEHPFGQMIESRRHKARVMREQGIREDGDRHHGSRDKGAPAKRPFRLLPATEKRLDAAIRAAVKKSNKRRP